MNSTPAPTRSGSATVRHGVTHVVVPDPGPVRARLVLRVGVVDELLPQRGLTHLVEHLTMRAVGRRHVQVNAHVGLWTTGFEASGPAQAVTEFVQDVWHALADLPLDALRAEKEVLRIEGLSRGVSPAVESAHHRFGVTGPGRAWADELGVPGATEADVRRWVAERFVRDAAVLCATADIRPDLSGGLADGRLHPLPPATEVPPSVAGPLWVGGAGGTAVSLLLPTRDGLDLAVGRLVREAAENVVRHERALAYEVGMDVAQVSPGCSEVAVHADCEPERHAEVAALLVGVLNRFRRDGPTAPEMAHERASTTSVWLDTPDALEVAAEQGVALLTGSRPRGLADRLGEAQDLTAGTVRGVVTDAWSSLQVLVPGEDDPGIEGVTECLHQDDPLPGRVHRGNPLAAVLPGARLPAPPSVSVTSGEEGLTLRMAPEVLSVRWDEVAAVVEEEDGLLVIGSTGAAIHLPDGTFWRSGRLRRDVEERLDRSLFVPHAGPAGHDADDAPMTP